VKGGLVITTDAHKSMMKYPNRSKKIFEQNELTSGDRHGTILNFHTRPGN